MVRRLARLVLTTSALFLLVMAILINSPALFYMATAMAATIAACAFQAYLSVRGLQIQRISPPAVNFGEVVTVSLIVRSERRIKRPLIQVYDKLPARLRFSQRTWSLPIAPAYDQPIQTRYSFRPLRRGVFTWSEVEVNGTDTLGLVTKSKVYEAEQAQLLVYPAPLPVNIDLRPSGGVGTSEAESGRFRGSGLEPRGIREYVPGDPQRYVHWTSSARSRNLMVKEFESGAGLAALIFIQRLPESDLAHNGLTSFEVACGHIKYLAEHFIKMGASVDFPSLPGGQTQGNPGWDERRQQVDQVLTHINPDQTFGLAEELADSRSLWQGQGSVYLFLSVAEPGLPDLIARHRDNEWVCLLYDAQDYSPPRKGQAASSTEYLTQLESAGAKVHLMPAVVEFQRQVEAHRARGVYATS